MGLETAGFSASAHQDEQQIRVHQFLRAPNSYSVSIERVFEDVRHAMPDSVDVRVVTNERLSRGFLPRLADAIAARRRLGQVNHILGDVHYLAWFFPRSRTVLTVLDCISLERLRGWRRWLFWLLWYWWPLKRAAYVTVLSEFTRRSLLSWVRYPADRIAVIPPPLSPEFTFSEPRPHARWSRLLTIGTSANKNLERIYEAVAGLQVTVVTIGTMSDDLVELADRLGIHYENHRGLDREELVDQYRKADILLFPSTYEGWGMPIVEAQATGRPVITSDICSMPEAAGGAACLVDPFDVGSIRAAVVRLLSDEEYAAGLIDAGQRNAQLYRSEKIAARYTELYRQVRQESVG